MKRPYRLSYAQKLEAHMDMQKKDSMKMNVPQAIYMTASACDAVGKTAVYNQGFFCVGACRNAVLEVISHT
jgi:hypothetical protein